MVISFVGRCRAAGILLLIAALGAPGCWAPAIGPRPSAAGLARPRPIKPAGSAHVASPALGAPAGPTAPAAPSPQPATSQPSSTPSLVPAGAQGVLATVATATQPTTEAAPTLAPDEAAAVEAAIGNELDAYLPADLVHDGGVALYRLAQVAPAIPTSPPPTAAAPTATPGGQLLPSPIVTSGTDAPHDGPPADWGRQQVSIGSREIGSGRATDAYAAVTFRNRGTFAYRDAGSGEVVRKPFAEVLSRRITMRSDGIGWRPAGLGPIRVESQGGASGLEITRIAVFQVDREVRLVASAADEALAIDALPHAPAGGTLRVEAAVSNRLQGQVFVFGRLAGDGPRARTIAHDDGGEGDRVAADGIYTWTVVLPDLPGVYHLAADVVDAGSFSRTGPYRALTKGLTVVVKRAGV